MNKIFVSTKRDRPCQICDKTNGNCRETEGDLLLCMTFADASNCIPGFKFIGLTKDGRWGEWLPDDGNSTEQQRAEWRQRQQALRQQRQQAEQQRRSTAMPAVERDRHYRKLLEQLTLHPADRADLHRRGLTDKQIEAGGFKSVEQWQRLEFELPHTLPGVSLDGRSLITQAGYLCPIRDVDGLIVGFQVRLREAEQGGRYRWLSSVTKKRPNGASAHLPNGENPITVARPIASIKRKAIGIVEGILKPFVTSQRIGQVLVGAAGGQLPSSSKTFKATLEQLSAEHGTRSIEIYPDAECLENQTVMRQYREILKLLQRWGYEVRVAWWQQFTKADGDIDELSDFSAIKLLTIGQFETIARNRRKGFAQLLNLLSQPAKPKHQPEQRQQAATTEVIEYKAGTRLDTYKKLVKQGAKFILDVSEPGSGKTFDAGRSEPTEFGVDRIIYCSDQHHNPSVETLAISYGWIDLQPRNSGGIYEATPSGGTRLRRAKAGEVPQVHGNCDRTHTAATLQGLGVAGANTSGLLCGSCPFKQLCISGEGANYGFLDQRRSALSSPKLRAHPVSLPDPNDLDYSKTGIWHDEPGQNFSTKRDIHVDQTDFSKTNTTLLGSPFYEALYPLFVTLMQLYSGGIKLGKYGANHTQLVAMLPDVSAINADALEQQLQPNLSFLNNQIDRDEAIAEIARQTVLKQWLPDLIRVLQGAKGNLRFNHSLIISLPDNRQREIAKATDFNIFLDATLSREDLALKLDVDPSEIIVIRQVMPETGNLTITQVTDMGRLGMQRGADQQKRASAIVSHFQQVDPTAKAIDFKRLASEGMGAWWRDSRGVNDFQKTRTLILIGTPCRNLSDLQAEYAILTGCRNADDAGFKAFVDRIILADIHQAIGRLRAHRRPDEQLQVILLSDFALDIPTRQVSAADITPDAADKSQRIVLAARRAIEHLKSAGEKITQSAIAAIVKCSLGKCTQSTISKLWEIITFAIESPNSKSDNSDEPRPDPDLVQLVETVATEADTEGLLLSLPDMLFQWFQPEQWRQLWQQLSAKAQTRILEAVILTLPDSQVEQMRRAIA